MSDYTQKTLSLFITMTVIITILQITTKVSFVIIMLSYIILHYIILHYITLILT